MKLYVFLVLVAAWLFSVTPTLSQFVVDTNGERIDSDDEYYIRPAITDNGGRFTLIDRNMSCPLYVGLENTDTPLGYPVKFTPFANNNHNDNDDDDDNLRVNRDLRVAFNEVSTTCVQSTEWRVGENDTTSGRRVIITGRDNTTGSYGNYFRIVETERVGIYNIQWCPTEVCPTCRFICGTGGILRENGKILFALGGTPLPVIFQKKDD